MKTYSQKNSATNIQELKREFLSFIAYPFHIESSCKLLSCSKLINITEGYNDKNRIYLSGTAIMSSKLLVGKEHSRKLCM